MTPAIVQKEGFAVIGIETRTRNGYEADPATARIPGIWQHFFTEQVEEKISQRINPTVYYAVYTEYESDYTGAYTYILGSAVSNLAALSRGMIKVELPASRYMVFTAQGVMPTAIIETWNEIWHYFTTNTTYHRAYTADFELYDKNNPEKVEIYIALFR